MPAWIANVLAGLGAIFTIYNVHTSLIRWPLHRLRGGTPETFVWVSGIPMFGSLFLWIAAALMHAHPTMVWGLVGLSLFDTGGLHWFAIVMLWQEVFEPRLKGRRAQRASSMSARTRS